VSPATPRNEMRQEMKLGDAKGNQTALRYTAQSIGSFLHKLRVTSTASSITLAPTSN